MPPYDLSPCHIVVRARALNDSRIIAREGNKAKDIVHAYYTIYRNTALDAGFILRPVQFRPSTAKLFVDNENGFMRGNFFSFLPTEPR